jgi:hypothetical protein
MLVRIGIIALTALVLTGCGGASRSAAENDRLRLRVIELEEEIEDLQGRTEELEAALEESRTEPGDPDPEVVAATPRPVKLSLGRLSHADDTDGDGRPDILVVLIEPADGLGRFIQLVGVLSVHACRMPTHEDCTTLGRTTLDPDDLREAYRSTVLGTHYSVRVPVSIEGEVPPECTVKAVFVDGYTGRELAANGTIDLQEADRLEG